MRFLIAAALMAALVPTAAFAQAPAAPAGRYTVDDTDLGTLLDDPAAKAVLVKDIPSVVNNDQIDMARSMTLKQLQSYAADSLTDKTLAGINADLAKLPPKK